MKTLDKQLRQTQQNLIEKRNMLNIQIEQLGTQRLILDIKKLLNI